MLFNQMERNDNSFLQKTRIRTVDPCALSEQDSAFHLNSEEDPKLIETLSFESPLPPHRGPSSLCQLTDGPS